MKFKILMIAVGLALSAGGIAACGSSNEDTIPPLNPPPAPPPPVVFSDFVADQFASTADDTDPAAVDDVDFLFDAQDDPNAFDDLLSSNP